MFEVSVALLAGFVVVLVAQFVWTGRFLSIYGNSQSTPDDAALPRTLVVLPLRGADPFLKDCLRGLMTQDYPCYDVRVVVDSRTDCAWPVVEEAIRESGASNVELKVLQSPADTCSLKMSALIQEFRDPDEQYDVVAWLDADTVPYPNWLRDLVSPMSDPTVGATTGIRWYAPSHSNMGTLVRTAWNVGAVIQMVAFDIAWGGSMACRARLFREPWLIEKWSNMLCEDVFTRAAMDELGLKLKFVAAATLPTRESITLRSCVRYMSRQMLLVRLYHRRWPLIAASGLWTAFAPLVASALWIAALVTENPTVATVCAAGLGVHVFGLLSTFLRAGFCVRRAVQARGEAPWKTPPGMLVAALMTPLVYVASLFKAMRSQTIDWRGITYEINGPWRIHMTEYRPYLPPQHAGGLTHSL